MFKNKNLPAIVGRLVVILWLFYTTIAKAEQNTDTHPKIESGQWNISLALGIGSRSNPLVGGDSLTLIVLPDVAWYGDKLYFDNGDLGYTLIDENDYSLSLVGRLNFERAYFSFLHPSNILLPSTGVEAPSPGDGTDGGEPTPPPDPTEPDVPPPSIDDIAKRDYAVDGGIQFNWFGWDHWRFSAGLMQDVSGTYKGQNGFVELSGQTFLGKLKLSGGFGLNYKSAKLVDYYYGLSSRDEVQQQFFYQGRSSINPFVKLTLAYQLTSDWQLLALARYSRLASGIKDSPLVDESATYTVYVGAAYEF